MTIFHVYSKLGKNAVVALNEFALHLSKLH